MAENKDIFVNEGTGTAQSAVAFKDPVRPSSVCSIQINGKDLSDNLNLLSVSGSGAVNLQIDVNFDNALFITVFGDKLTPLTFRGVALPSACDEETSGNAIINFFNKYKASASSTIDVITIAYNKGDFVFKGILTQMALNPYTQAGADAFTFDITLQGRVMSKSTGVSASDSASSSAGGSSSDGSSSGDSSSGRAAGDVGSRSDSAFDIGGSIGAGDVTAGGGDFDL